MKKVIILFCAFLVSLSFANASSIFLSDYLEEGQTRVYETDGGVYVINLLSVSEVKQKAVFRLNDEMSKGIKLKDSYVFNDGSEVVLRELVINDAGEGNDEAYYYFYGTGKGVLPLSNVSMYAIEELCNFDGQCLNETKDDCCYDCGCDKDEECVNNRCVSKEEEETEDVETEEDVKEEIEEEGVEEKEGTSEEKEKRAAYAMLGIILFLIIVLVWFVIEKKRKLF